MLKIKSALISVFDKNGIETIAKKLNSLGIKIFSTGGTELYLKEIGIPVIKIEDITSYPSILGGRVKTLHPKVFGGILSRRNNEKDTETRSKGRIRYCCCEKSKSFCREETTQKSSASTDQYECWCDSR